MFQAMMRVADVDPAGYTFVDFGCGKGRALVLAADFGFKRAIGVELAPSLYQTARDNVELYRRRRARGAPIEVHCGDAAQFEVPGGDLMLYFYHPFGESVMRRVALNIERAWRLRARNLVVAYRNPVHSRVFDELGWLRLVTRNRSFAIYA
jgi:SAM-dependent methyltransferase